MGRLIGFTPGWLIVTLLAAIVLGFSIGMVVANETNLECSPSRNC